MLPDFSNSRSFAVDAISSASTVVGLTGAFLKETHKDISEGEFAAE